MIDILSFLKKNNIPFKKYDHEAVFTAEEAKTKASHVPGTQTKNLFLCDDKKRRFYLVTICEHKRANLKHLREFLNEKSLRFAPENFLLQHLGLTPGSVSPLGLINDLENIVTFYIDSDLLREQYIYVHPNINTATLEINNDDFKKFINLINHSLNIYQLPND